ncbi:hypothetical protein SALBM311S_03640 [Streptomyces alboniger]
MLVHDWMPGWQIVYWVVPLGDPPGNAWGEQAWEILWYLRTYLWLMMVPEVGAVGRCEQHTACSGCLTCVHRHQTDQLRHAHLRRFGCYSHGCHPQRYWQGNPGPASPGSVKCLSVAVDHSR